MKLLSWNVNGIRACITKGFYDFLQESNPDILCIQETKMQVGQEEINTPGYLQYHNSAIKKGYSGVMLFTKVEPISVRFGMGIEKHDQEGRLVTAEYEEFYFVGCYTPNSQNELKRLDYRQEWEEDFLEYLKQLDKIKPVILCGDLNVAHQEIDLKNPKSNRKNAGFSDEERACMDKLLSSGFIDTYRYLYPEKIEYSWWSYRFNARKNNAGWRIDYFITSSRLNEKIQNSTILGDVFGSDHCPVGLEINI